MLPVLLAALESEADQRFFHQFYHKYKTDFYRFALSLLHDPHWAEEAVQEGWMKCVQNAGDFFAVAPKQRRAWMAVLLKRVCLDLREKEARTAQLDEAWDQAAPDPGDPQGIVDLIRAMSEQYRTILELKFVLEWSDKAIARELHLPVATVSTRISRGRKLLQERLIKEGYWYGPK